MKLQKRVRMSQKKKLKKTSKKATKKTSQKVTKKAIKKTSKKATKKVAKKSTKKTAQKGLKKIARKTLKKTSQKATKKAIKKTLKKSVKKSPKKVLKKTAQKTAQKAIQKTAQIKIKKQPKKTVQKKTSEPRKSYLNFLEEELKSILEKKKQVLIKSSEGYTYCLEENCDQNATTGGYCRYHYLSLWEQIKTKNKILSENTIKQHINQIVKKYSPQVLDHMVRDLSNEKDFSSALSEMKALDKSTSSL